MIGQTITRHPDFEEIVEFFNRGGSCREMETLLEARYGKGNKYSINYLTLNGFRKNYMKFDKAKITEIRNLRKLNAIKGSRGDKELDAQAKVNTCLSILEKKEELLENDIDVIDEQFKFLAKIEDQMSEIATIETLMEDPSKRIRAKEVLAKFLSEYRQFLEGVHKRQADAKTGGNVFNANNMQINITQVNNYVDDIKYVVVETFKEECPHLLPSFLIKLSERLNNMTVRSNKDIIDAEVL